jgi:MFS family permease
MTATSFGCTSPAPRKCAAVTSARVATSSPGSARDRRWLILGVVGVAQLMVILDLTVMNIAPPSAQHALHFSRADRQWVITAYTLAFGSLLLLGGRLAGLLLGGALTEYLSWRWCLYVNLLFAAVAFAGGSLLLKRQPSPARPRLDIAGVLLASSAVFCLVYGFSNAATHNWATPSSYGFIWLAQLGPHTGYATGVLGPLILAGIGLGMIIAPVINTGWRWCTATTPGSGGSPESSPVARPSAGSCSAAGRWAGRRRGRRCLVG